MKKSIFYSVLSVMLVLVSLFSLSSSKTYAAASPPTIAVTSPTADQPMSNVNVSLSGTYSTDPSLTLSDYLFTAYDSAKAISDSAKDPADWKFPAVGNWSFSKTLKAGTHVITVKIKQKAGTVNYLDSNEAITTALTFTISRPTIKSSAIITGGKTLTGEDFTHVAKDAKVRFTLSSKNPLDQLVSKIRTQSYNPVNVVSLAASKGETSAVITGTAEISDPIPDVNGKYIADITFTPKNDLTLGRSFLAYLLPTLTDDADNPVYAKFFKFTTMSSNDPAKQDDAANPHGHYSLKTNMCANCHSSHVENHLPETNTASDTEGGSYLVTFNTEMQANADRMAQSYCMACHDGTMNKAPAIDNIYNKYHHDNPADYTGDSKDNHLKDAVSCTSCHNPHLEWSETNQNLLKDHLVYTHKDADVGQKQAFGEALTSETLAIDSLDQPCDSCHGSNEINRTLSVSVLSYKKSTSAVGKSDYSLCLRCHNTAKKAKDTTLADIDQYYNDANSGHYFALGGNATQADSSTLNGPMPCADCHETHGSNVDKMLREQLGNVQTADKFKTTGAQWNTANDERTFCLKCHNNNPQTAIYGKIGVFNTKDGLTNNINGHQPGDTQTCSSCHFSSASDASADEKALSAAHAPKKTSVK